MDNQKRTIINILIMIGPILLPAFLMLIRFGESFLFLAIPLLVFLVMAVSLAERLSLKEAISYVFVQYSFLVLMTYLTYVRRRGLELILIIPMLVLINTVIGYSYFRFVKNKKWYLSVLVLLFTLLVTFYLS